MSNKEKQSILNFKIKNLDNRKDMSEGNFIQQKIVKMMCIVSVIFFNTPFHSQITINNTSYSPAQLVDGVLIPTGAVTSISNVSFKGVYNKSSRYQLGYFSTATTTLAQMGFANGVVISTGNTSDIPLALGTNPGGAAQMSTGYTSSTTGEIRQGGTTPTYINDLDVLAGSSNYFNGAILEFDFVPISNSVQFRYIFGSEEYRDDNGSINYNCSSYNDKFAFLISGPGIAGGQGYTNDARNIARLSNGSEVAINSVNNGMVGSSGGSPSASFCQSANPAWLQNVSTAEFLGTIDGTELNGNTKILTASQTGLTPGQTYHIKLIVTDVNDAAYDSVVFLEALSFTTQDPPCTNPSAPIIGTITQPTCTDPKGTVVLSGLPSSGAWTLVSTPSLITISGSGSTYTVNDLIDNSNYTFTVSSNGCTSAASANVAINAQPITPNAPTIGTITQPTCSVATASVVVNDLPASGTWTLVSTPAGVNQTGTGTTYTATGLPANTTYTFTVSNGTCTSVSSANAVINAQPTTPNVPTFGTITQPTCSVATGSVVVNGLPASGSWTLVSTPAGVNQTGTGTSYTVAGLTANTTYTFIVSSGACVSPSSVNVAINAQPVVPSAPIIGNLTQPTCSTSTGDIVINGLPSTGSWTLVSTPAGVNQTGTGTTYTATGLTANTTYTFTVSNGICTSGASVNAVINAQPITPSAPIVGNITQPSCNLATGSVSLSGLPSTGTWTLVSTPVGINQTGSGSTYTVTGLSANSTYTFTVTNGACTSGVSNNVVLNAQPSTPVSVLSADFISGTAPLIVTFSNGSIGGTSFDFDFGNGSLLTVNNTNNQIQTYTVPGNYNVVLTTTNGTCTSTDAILITVIAPKLPEPILNIPNVFTPNGDNANDVFNIQTVNVSTLEVVVMNRWGDVMCEYNTLAGFWNGQVNGQDATEGVYFYKYKAVGLNGEELTGHGFIHLER